MAMRRWTRQGLLGSVLVCALAVAGGGCSSDDEAPAKVAKAVPGVSVRFDLGVANGSDFYDFPYPADARLKADGTPAVAGFPNPEDKAILSSLLKIAGERPGFPTIPVAYFHFDAAIADQQVGDVIAADAGSKILLVDIDPASPDRGKLFPTIAKLPAPDIYVPENLLAVASFPGVVLNSSRSYAFVVMRGLGDASGAPLGSPLEFEQVKLGQDPEGAEGLAAQYEPLWETLDALGVDPGDVAAATVFTTGDVVKQTYELSQRVLEKYDVTLDNLEIDPDDGATHDRFCEILGTVDFPQFQVGTPPFDTEGLFAFGDDGLPIEQRKETAKIVITLPKQPMPAGGYPLVMYFHGSGGVAGQVVDRGRVTEPGGETTKGEGPAFVLAPHGFATVGSSHPVSPDRLPGASDIAYLNFKNLAAMRDTFRQGVIEQRLYLEALSKLEISPDLVAACDGLSLPSGETSYHFATKPILAMGQSMGGMYTNMIGAVEPRIEAVVPTGAGGFWSFFVEETEVVPNLDKLAGILLGSKETLDHLHPALQILQTGWETVDPMVYTPRLARRHLEGHPARSVYEPVGKGDSYFSTKIYDAFSLAYGNQQAGDQVWPEMQASLAVGGFDGFAEYPITDNRVAADGTPYTGVVVQYEGDGIYDPHAIYGQLDAVKHQYGCFFETYLKTGKATVRAPETIDAPCQ